MCIRDTRKGGQTVYFGDIGKNSATLLEYFERNGARKCDSSENPAEYILEAIGAGATAVSYTHLDVYKRQPFLRSNNLSNSSNKVAEG